MNMFNENLVITSPYLGKRRATGNWNVAVICSIHKEDNLQICNNYRGITLLNVPTKYCPIAYFIGLSQ